MSAQNRPVRKRIRFDLRVRLRDHCDCYLYYKCLDTAAEINAPRVCWEACPLFIQPHPRKPAYIAEILEGWREHFWRKGRYDDDDTLLPTDEELLPDRLILPRSKG